MPNMDQYRRNRYPDRHYNAGRSAICPHREGEAPMARHDRRRETAADMAGQLREWCEANGAELQISNGGHHWIIIRGERRAEWWPSSGKCVTDKRWADGHHIHDVEQLMRHLEAAFGLKLWGVDLVDEVNDA